MSLTNPSLALGQFLLLSTSLRLLPPSGIPLFFTNLFRPAPLLALPIGLQCILGWPYFSRWIPNELTSCPTSFYSTYASASIPLQLFLGSFSIALFSYLFKHVSSMKGEVCSSSQGLVFQLCFLMGPLQGVLLSVVQSVFWPLLTCALPEWFPFLSATNVTTLERLDQAASRVISGCLSSSRIPLFLSEASLPSL